MGKYDPLRDHLVALSGITHPLTMTFSEVEGLVGSLPRSARVHRAWWSNTADASVQTRAWRAAGWRIQSVDMVGEQVIFVGDGAGEVLAKVGQLQEAAGAGTTTVRGQATHPADSGGGEAASGPERPSRRAVLSGVAAAAVTGAAAAVSGVVGIAHLPWPALALLSAGAAVTAALITQAVISDSGTPAAIGQRWWAASTLLMLLVSAGLFTYHKFLDPATRAPRTYQLVVKGGEADFIDLYGEAGGPAQTLATGAAGQNGLIGGQSYNFDCWTIGLDGREWLRYERFHQTWWAPRTLLKLPFGESQPLVPRCK